VSYRSTPLLSLFQIDREESVRQEDVAARAAAKKDIAAHATNLYNPSLFSVFFSEKFFIDLPKTIHTVRLAGEPSIFLRSH
jgi:hypothetical protein